MPKIYLTEQAKHDELLLGNIRAQQARLRLRNQDVAQKMGINRNTYGRRLKCPGTFTRDELNRLFSILRFTDEQRRESGLW